MNVKDFVLLLTNLGVGFYVGVPDSQLKPFCNYLVKMFGISDRHVITANEGNAVALAAGYHLSTGRIPSVYLQNSGLGNIINPVTSLLSDKVYAIPCVFVIGWRGEPNVHDEPQHLFQGQITLELLKVLEIAYVVVDENTTKSELLGKLQEFKALLEVGKSVAFVIRKGGLTYNEKVEFKNNYTTSREEIIRHIVNASGGDIIVSTTGKTSRELFEIREQNSQSHKYDFLTVGSMGHCSSIALGVALNKPNKRVWCLDGDGAALMHMGAMAVIGALLPKNFVHVVINNEAHESVGGQPTIAGKVDFQGIALSCGYKTAYKVTNIEELEDVLSEIKDKEGPILIEAKAVIGSRSDLGRPTKTPVENKIAFMQYLKECR